jgi:hypothetical protein
MISLMKLLKGGLRKKLLDFCVGMAHVPHIEKKKKMEMLTLAWFCFILVFFFFFFFFFQKHKIYSRGNFGMINALKGYGQPT